MSKILFSQSITPIKYMVSNVEKQIKNLIIKLRKGIFLHIKGISIVINNEKIKQAFSFLKCSPPRYCLKEIKVIKKPNISITQLNNRLKGRTQIINNK